jgi:hypothetical protein
MNATERGHASLRKASRYYNIPLTSFSNHFNGRTKSKKNGPPRCVNKTRG